MTDYKKMYFTLFHAVTDVIDRLEKADKSALARNAAAQDMLWAENKLKNAQLACEEIFADTDTDSIYEDGTNEDSIYEDSTNEDGIN